MGPNTRTTDWSLADDDLDTAMGPTTTHDVENGAPDVQLDDASHLTEMVTSKPFEEAKTDSTRDRPVKVLRSYPLLLAVLVPALLLLLSPVLVLCLCPRQARSHTMSCFWGQ